MASYLVNILQRSPDERTASHLDVIHEEISNMKAFQQLIRPFTQQPEIILELCRNLSYKKLNRYQCLFSEGETQADMAFFVLSGTMLIMKEGETFAEGLFSKRTINFNIQQPSQKVLPSQKTVNFAGYQKQNTTNLMMKSQNSLAEIESKERSKTDSIQSPTIKRSRTTAVAPIETKILESSIIITEDLSPLKLNKQQESSIIDSEKGLAESQYLSPTRSPGKITKKGNALSKFFARKTKKQTELDEEIDNVLEIKDQIRNSIAELRASIFQAANVTHDIQQFGQETSDVERVMGLVVQKLKRQDSKQAYKDAHLKNMERLQTKLNQQQVMHEQYQDELVDLMEEKKEIDEQSQDSKSEEDDDFEKEHPQMSQKNKEWLKRFYKRNFRYFDDLQERELQIKKQTEQALEKSIADQKMLRSQKSMMKSTNLDSSQNLDVSSIIRDKSESVSSQFSNKRQRRKSIKKRQKQAKSRFAMQFAASNFDYIRPEDKKLEQQIQQKFGGVVARLKYGAIIGEKAIIEKAPRGASVFAGTQCELICIFKKDFDVLLKEFEISEKNKAKFLSNHFSDFDNISSKNDSNYNILKFFVEIQTVINQRVIEEGKTFISENGKIYVVYGGCFQIQRKFRKEIKKDKQTSYKTEYITIGTLSPGDFFGEHPLVETAGTYDYTVCCTSDYGRLLQVDVSNLIKKMPSEFRESIEENFYKKEDIRNQTYEKLTAFKQKQIDKNELANKQKQNFDHKLLLNQMRIDGDDNFEAPKIDVFKSKGKEAQSPQFIYSINQFFQRISNVSLEESEILKMKIESESYKISDTSWRLKGNKKDRSPAKQVKEFIQQTYQDNLIFATQNHYRCPDQALKQISNKDSKEVKAKLLKKEQDKRLEIQQKLTDTRFHRERQKLEFTKRFKYDKKVKHDLSAGLLTLPRSEWSSPTNVSSIKPKNQVPFHLIKLKKLDKSELSKNELSKSLNTTQSNLNLTKSQFINTEYSFWEKKQKQHLINQYNTEMSFYQEPLTQYGSFYNGKITDDEEDYEMEKVKNFNQQQKDEQKNNQVVCIQYKNQKNDKFYNKNLQFSYNTNAVSTSFMPRKQLKESSRSPRKNAIKYIKATNLPQKVNQEFFEFPTFGGCV